MLVGLVEFGVACVGGGGFLVGVVGGWCVGGEDWWVGHFFGFVFRRRHHKKGYNFIRNKVNMLEIASGGVLVC